MEARRSGNFKASIWDDDFLQSLTSPYTAKEYLKQADKLKWQVKVIIKETKQRLDQLDLIDNIQRLGISHHFRDEIQRVLQNIYEKMRVECPDRMLMEKDLYSTSLQFRLLRQHGYHVSQDVFCSFMDGAGNFQAVDDLKGILALYEASFLSREGENILGSARDFSTRHLKQKLEEITDPILAEKIRRALELPLHWRLQKLEAIWFINIYESRFDANLILLQLAKLEFNMVQAQYQEDLKWLSRWYKETGLPEKMNFARDRLAECFLWALGFIPEAHLGQARKILTKIAVLIVIMDDFYDIYGTLDEIKVFTEELQRWDINALDNLPEYMRICFLAIFNTANEIAYDILRDQGINIISNLRRLWAELGRVYYTEAKWYHSGYFPSTEEYLNVAWISITGPVLLFHAYFSIMNPIDMKELQYLEQYPGIIRWPSTVLRLADDLGTASDEIKRGDVPKSIQCYMHETGCSEEEAREYVKQLIDTTLKKMNKEILMEKPTNDFGATAMNLARISLFFYQYGDGFGVPHNQTKENLVSLIVKPICLT
uniref:Trans-alpha-bergamotene synthase n=1 Tax=Phyla dulcis TaxID=542674 RepID=TPS7_PHYDL|nr:RecName: Full=Trans-alpha-bergamotene synthase; AltName: Full=Terpene synthase 7; Short=LdTPS7 [Phyla dulcis]AFR23371.1 trans-alpha-bergamotene synthase [Phyla dulcis]